VLRRANTYNWRPLLKASLILCVVALIVALPVYLTLFSEGKGLVVRMQTVGVGGKEEFVDIQTAGDLLRHFIRQFRNALLLHVSTPENALYYKGETALLLPMVVPLFILGMVWCFVRAPFRVGASLILVWIGLTVLGNLLMQDSRISARYVVAFPALILAVALGLRAVVDLLLRRHKRLRVAVPVLVTVALMLFQVAYYFTSHLPLYRQQFREGLGIESHDALLRAAAFEQEIVVIFIGNDLIPERDAIDYMDYLNPRHAVVVMTPDAFDADAAASINRNFNHVFFVTPDDVTTIRRLHAFFPQLQGPFDSPRDIPAGQEMLLYYLPR
jgi:4-amino-4-deoxy-L-arabinose transferase-like glycosyltransferase